MEQKEKNFHKRLLRNSGTWKWQVWPGVSCPIKKVQFYLCFESYRKTTPKRRGNYLAVHQITENTNLPEPPQYYQNVWFLR